MGACPQLDWEVFPDCRIQRLLYFSRICRVEKVMRLYLEALQ